jgi:hypothetical protein
MSTTSTTTTPCRARAMGTCDYPCVWDTSSSSGICRNRQCSDLNYFECQADSSCLSAGSIMGEYTFVCYNKGGSSWSLLGVWLMLAEGSSPACSQLRQQSICASFASACYWAPTLTGTCVAIGMLSFFVHNVLIVDSLRLIARMQPICTAQHMSQQHLCV